MVEAERHVPRLGGEDHEDRRQLEPQQVVGKEGDEEGQSDRQEHQDGDGLQDVEDRDEHLLRSAKTCRRRPVHQGEHRREGKGDEHPQERSSGVVGHVGDVGRDDDRRPARSEVDGHRLAEPDDGVEEGDDASSHHEVHPTEPAASQHLPDGKCRPYRQEAPSWVGPWRERCIRSNLPTTLRKENVKNHSPPEKASSNPNDFSISSVRTG